MVLSYDDTELRALQPWFVKITTCCSNKGLFNARSNTLDFYITYDDNYEI